MNDIQKPPHVYEAVKCVTAELARDGIAKSRSNQQQNYKFRGIDDVYNALSSVIAANNLCIFPRMLKREVCEKQSKSGGVLFYVVVEAEFDFVSAVDGSKHVVRTFGEAMDSGDKATNKAMSAAYKYACFQAFCIPTEGDHDADSTTHEVAARNGRPAQAQPTKAPPAKAPPANGAELMTRLSAYDATLSNRKQCDPGALVKHIEASGGPKFGPKMDMWDAAAIKWAVAEAKAFDARTSSK